MSLEWDAVLTVASFWHFVEGFTTSSLTRVEALGKKSKGCLELSRLKLSEQRWDGEVCCK